ncbi:MAG: SIS domain-containing protein, partial [Proteobacteria bacterium]|nr:SIS domain-containing protein [Pseudomonadota bacterium]
MSINYIQQHLNESVQVLQLLQESSTLAPTIDTAAAMMTQALRAGNKILFCGNGGSAADSQHLAAEFSGRFLRDRQPLAAMALTVDSSALTAIGNDYGYEQIFSRQVTGIGRSGDVLVAISTSGESANVVEAAIAARHKGIHVIALTG